MQNTPSPKGWWFWRHRKQHAAYRARKSTALNPRTTERFAAEFEQALRARGAAAKEGRA